MAGVEARSFDSPDETRTPDKTRIDLVRMTGASAARFSLELRTVSAEDIHARRGAPNVDGKAPRVAWRWFTGITSSASLTELAEPRT